MLWGSIVFIFLFIFFFGLSSIFCDINNPQPITHTKKEENVIIKLGLVRLELKEKIKAYATC